jgi:hypothetical protein
MHARSLHSQAALAPAARAAGVGAVKQTVMTVMMDCTVCWTPFRGELQHVLTSQLQAALAPSARAAGDGAGDDDRPEEGEG